MTQHWPGFPAHKLRVENVVTLGTPHQGVAKPSAHDDRQWQQMRPGSGFLERLQQDGLGEQWAATNIGDDLERLGGVEQRAAVEVHAAALQAVRDGLA
jgi:hypothetical protein